MTMELDKYDDYYIHQQKKSIIEVEEDDPKWFDRCYIACLDPDGKFGMSMGIGVYPNAGLMDGWVSVATGTHQRNIRVFRHVKKDRAVMHIGPLEFDIIEPQECWRLQLKENEYGVSFDMECRRKGPVYGYDPILQPNPEGSNTLVWLHAAHVPVFNGTLTVDGKKYDVRNAGYFRDRSWGTRALWQYGCYWLCYVPFSNYCIYLTHIENVDNSIFVCSGCVAYDDGRVIDIVNARHKTEFIPGTWRHLSTEWEITLKDGTKMPLTMKKVYQSILCYGAGYCWRQGIDVGSYHIESDDYEINDPAYMEMPTDVYDQLVEYDDGKEKARGWLEYGTLNANYKYKATL